MDQTDTQMQDVLLRTATEAACSSLLKHTCSYTVSDFIGRFVSMSA